MLVEFLGIAFFSFVMGSVSNILLVDTTGPTSVNHKMKEIDMWLVRLDSARTKLLPKMLYDKTKLFIRESMLYDYKELISGNNFLFQLKPALRYEVVYSLFTRFIDNDFHYLFKHEVNGYRLETGNEFITKFVSQLNCRVFAPN